jgi:hypothetical protein
VLPVNSIVGRATPVLDVALLVVGRSSFVDIVEQATSEKDRAREVWTVVDALKTISPLKRRSV